ncbi:MAG: hypothetical protein D6820_08060, partial [Lentisphaerae bacterium]
MSDNLPNRLHSIGFTTLFYDYEADNLSGVENLEGFYRKVTKEWHLRQGKFDILAHSFGNMIARYNLEFKGLVARNFVMMAPMNKGTHMATLVNILALGAGNEGSVREVVWSNLREILGLVGGEGTDSVGLTKGTWNDNSATFLMDPVFNTFIKNLNRKSNLRTLNMHVQGAMRSFSDPFDIPVTLFDGHGMATSLITDRYD